MAKKAICTNFKDNKHPRCKHFGMKKVEKGEVLFGVCAKGIALKQVTPFVLPDVDFCEFFEVFAAEAAPESEPKKRGRKPKNEKNDSVVEDKE